MRERERERLPDYHLTPLFIYFLLDFKDRHGIVPDIGHIHCLLGTVAKLQHRKGTAIDYFQTALSHNPYLWDAYSHLSQLGK